MAKEKPKSAHGGARAGAGRKDPQTKKRMNFTIALDLVAKLEAEPNKSEVVDKALRMYYQRK